jgi:hypothetical protein
MHSFHSVSKNFSDAHWVRRAATMSLSLITLAGLFGCAAFTSSNSFSDSSGSASDSVGSFSDSSTSSGEGGETSFRESVEAYTTIAALERVSPESLQRGINEIALSNGISDWETVSAAWLGIESGLSTAEISHVDRRAYYAALRRPGVLYDAAAMRTRASTQK